MTEQLTQPRIANTESKQVFPAVSANDSSELPISTPDKKRKNEIGKKLRRFKLNMTLKVSICFGIPLLVGFGALSKMMFDSAYEFQSSQMDGFADVISDQLAASAVEPVFADAVMELGILVQQIPLNKYLIGVGIYDHLGTSIAQSGYVPPAENIDLNTAKAVLAAATFFPDMGKSQADIRQDQLRNTVLYSKPIRFRDVTGGYALVVFNQKSLEGSMRETSYAMVTISIVLIIFLACVVLYFSHRITAPVRSIVDAANRIDGGDMSPILERRNDELGQLINAINNMTKGLAEKSQIKEVLDKFLAPDIAAKILGELDSVDFKGENVEATVLFADIVGFTNMSEKMSPDKVSALLNEYFGYYSACAKLHFGTVDKFLGDCIMLVFGVSKDDPMHRYHAASCAVLMQELTRQINAMRAQRGMQSIEIRIGINSGKMLAGLLGSRDRMEYTVIGDSVNLASRLCNEAKQGEIIIQEDFKTNVALQHQLELGTGKTIKIRGKTDPVPIYNLKNINKPRANGDRALIDDLLEKAHNSMTPI